MGRFSLPHSTRSLPRRSPFTACLTTPRCSSSAPARPPPTPAWRAYTCRAKACLPNARLRALEKSAGLLTAQMSCQPTKSRCGPSKTITHCCCQTATSFLPNNLKMAVTRPSGKIRSLSRVIYLPSLPETSTAVSKALKQRAVAKCCFRCTATPAQKSKQVGPWSRLSVRFVGMKCALG